MNIFVLFGLGLLIGILILIIFKNGFDENVDIVIISKSIKRCQIILSKILVIFIICLLISLITMSLSLFTFLNEKLDKEYYLSFVSSIFLYILLTSLIMSSLSCIFSVFFVKSIVISLPLLFVFLSWFFLSIFGSNLITPLKILNDNKVTTSSIRYLSKNDSIKYGVKFTKYDSIDGFDSINEASDLWNNCQEKRMPELSSYLNIYNQFQFFCNIGNNSKYDEIQAMSNFGNNVTTYKYTIKYQAYRSIENAPLFFVYYDEHSIDPDIYLIGGEINESNFLSNEIAYMFHDSDEPQHIHNFELEQLINKKNEFILNDVYLEFVNQFDQNGLWINRSLNMYDYIYEAIKNKMTINNIFDLNKEILAFRLFTFKQLSNDFYKDLIKYSYNFEKIFEEQKYKKNANIFKDFCIPDNKDGYISLNSHDRKFNYNSTYLQEQKMSLYHDFYNNFFIYEVSPYLSVLSVYIFWIFMIISMFAIYGVCYMRKDIK